jgi:hypothetical protein
MYIRGKLLGFNHILPVSTIQYTTTMAIATSVMKELVRLNQHIVKACDQVKLLNRQIEELDIRYDRAAKENKKAFRYSLRLRLATLEGFRTAYLEYAQMKAQEMDKIEEDLIAKGQLPPQELF